jgi:hypothetical protein
MASTKRRAEHEIGIDLTDDNDGATISSEKKAKGMNTHAVSHR